ncbi:thiamine pyrophosphate-requiring protein [Paenibacillus validus]|uniref:Thiamine pyrophosphate-requiring protein n=1 Tax=Paenibacillus validus TaxID=44253 RepID=A0A7X2ZDD4_9BACL|nr:thiamine pyrophosphate-requiring protein [Paenibacillus validus]MUG72173.1 thiamine pyrophosphate-requiring protein [Paenibacillus validus]
MSQSITGNPSSAANVLADRVETGLNKKYTTATAFMEALHEAGVSCIFANLGSDHPAIIEEWAQAQLQNKDYPRIIICPHEFVALSAAHTYAQISGKPQAVFVHVECGTQNLGGAVHNAAKGRVPVLIFAGASPYTQEGELVGSRNEHIHWIQDVFDQRGIVRQYMKYDNEIRTGKNVKQLVHRAIQIAESDPKGPVYLVAPREVLEEETQPISSRRSEWEPLSPSAIHPAMVSEIANDLLKAKKPLIITTYLGRNPEAVDELVKFSERLAIPVLESAPYYLNFPGDHPLQVGYQWNKPGQNPILAEADLILVLDSDVPWMPLHNKPSKDCTIYYIDIDPLKEKTPLWYIPSKRSYKADSFVALQQLNAYLDTVRDQIDDKAVQERYQQFTEIHNRQREEWNRLEQLSDSSVITPEYLTACIREAIDEDTIVLFETITNYETVSKHLPRTKPGTIFGSGASSLGWHGGGAIGAKLAAPDQTIVSLTGDGSYIFSNPTPVHWVSKKYNTPFLTVIYNNHGWGAPRMSTLGVHPQGIASQTDQFWVNFDPTAELAKVAEAAGGAYARVVEKPGELMEAIVSALQIVREGRSAVLDVRLPQVSKQSTN